jgi:hypothetical protein
MKHYEVTASNLIKLGLIAAMAARRANTVADLHDAGNKFVEFMVQIAITPPPVQRAAAEELTSFAEPMPTLLEVFQCYREAGIRVASLLATQAAQNSVAWGA